MKTQLDHLVVDVHNRLDEGLKRWQRLGFLVTPRGHHSLGSANNLMIFDTDYLELLGWEGDTPPPRPELADLPIGLNGLVFRDWGHEALYADLQARGVPVLEPRSFIRPVGLEDGSIAGDARFTTTRLAGHAVFNGRTYFCEHYTPELVWRPEWRAHPNTVQSVSRVVIAAADPAKPMVMLERMFGPGAVQGHALPLAKARIEAVPPATLGAMLPEAGGRGDFLALIAFKVADLGKCTAALTAGAIPFETSGDVVRVSPAETMNVALEFHA